MTSLDLLQALYSSDNITFEQMLEHRTRLRRAGYLFIPVTSDKLEHYLSHAEVTASCLIETAELKAIRENLLRIRMSPFLQLPKEARWFDGFTQTFISVLKAQWCPEIEETTAIARSEWLLDLLDLRGWAHCFGGDGDQWIASCGFSGPILLLLSAPPKTNAEITEKYLRWVDERILTTIRQEEPEVYSFLLNRTKELIAQLVERHSSKESK